MSQCTNWIGSRHERTQARFQTNQPNLNTCPLLRREFRRNNFQLHDPHTQSLSQTLWWSLPACILEKLKGWIAIQSLLIQSKWATLQLVSVCPSDIWIAIHLDFFSKHDVTLSMRSLPSLHEELCLVSLEDWCSLVTLLMGEACSPHQPGELFCHGHLPLYLASETIVTCSKNRNKCSSSDSCTRWISNKCMLTFIVGLFYDLLVLFHLDLSSYNTLSLLQRVYQDLEMIVFLFCHHTVIMYNVWLVNGNIINCYHKHLVAWVH